MAGFIILDLELFSRFPDLSDGARILYGYIVFKMRYAETDEDGQKYITYHGDDDPRPVLGLTKRQLFYRSDELVKNKLIKVVGSGWSSRVYLGDKNVTEFDNLGDKNVTEIDETCETRLQKCDRDGDKNVTETVTKMSPSPFNINIEKNINIENKCVYNTPSINEIFEEANAKHYIIRDPQKFLEYNEAREWRGVGGVQNWRLALKLWHNKEIEKAAGENSGSITGAQAGIVYHCPVELEPYKVDNPTTVTAEDIKAAEEIQALFDNAINNIIDLF